MDGLTKVEVIKGKHKGIKGVTCTECLCDYHYLMIPVICDNGDEYIVKYENVKMLEGE